MIEELDVLDKKILAELNQNPKANCSTIAKKIKSSKEVVNYHIRRLIKNGVIEKFVTVFGLGYWAYKIFVQLTDISIEEEEALLNYLERLPNINWVTTCSGNWDVTFAIMAKDPRCFYETLQNIINKIGKSLKEYKFAITIESRIFGHTYILKSIKDDIYVESRYQKHPIFDEKDKMIARIIYSNARAKIIDISAETNIPAETLKYRIKKMEKAGIIKRYRTIINPTKIGYQRFEILINCINLSKTLIQKFEEYARQNPNISFYGLCVGGWNIEFTVNLKNTDELRLFMLDVKKTFGSSIKSIETANLFNTRNYAFLPKELSQ